MKAKNIILTLAAATVALSSCNSLLDIPQHGAQSLENYYQTDEEAENAIIACYIQAKGNSYNALLGKNMLTDDFWAGGAARADNAQLEQLNEFTFATDQGFLEGMFTSYYGIIYKANVVIGHVPEETEVQKQYCNPNTYAPTPWSVLEHAAYAHGNVATGNQKECKDYAE